jgi:hypothetical protein
VVTALSSSTRPAETRRSRIAALSVATSSRVSAIRSRADAYYLAEGSGLGQHECQKQPISANVAPA